MSAPPTRLPPPIAQLTVFGLWFIHNSVVNLPGNTRLISPGWRHGLNVFATGSAYLICAFCNLAFNHLVLTAISLPAFVACVQMGATCVALLLINGTFGALYHSRTSNLFKGMRKRQPLHPNPSMNPNPPPPTPLPDPVPLPPLCAPRQSLASSLAASRGYPRTTVLA